MSTLLLRLAAPMQSWGVGSKFNFRTTNLEPTRSGVIGMIAGAMGVGREDSLADFSKLKFGVRIDQPGELDKDFHMVHQEIGTKINSWLTNRYYLFDAVFLVGLEGEMGLLKSIDDAIKKPVYPIYLGRRSCPPTGEISLGIRPMNLRDTLRCTEWQASDWYKKSRRNRMYTLDIVRDADEGETGYNIKDVPESFSQKRREYSWRSVIREQLPLDAILECPKIGSRESTEHNPMDLLEEYDVSIASTNKSEL